MWVYPTAKPDWSLEHSDKRTAHAISYDTVHDSVSAIVSAISYDTVSAINNINNINKMNLINIKGSAKTQAVFDLPKTRG